MFIHELKPAKGSKKSKKRIGRGTGSGLGTTAGKGHKGQKARAGKGANPGFEGGQKSMIRRTPKRGFNNARFATNYEVVNVGDIERLYNPGEVVDLLSLKGHGLIHGNLDGVKVLGNGKLTKKLTFTVNKVSSSASEQISASGGEINLLPEFKANEEVALRKANVAKRRAEKLQRLKK